MRPCDVPGMKHLERENVIEKYLITLGFTFNMFPSTSGVHSFASISNNFFASISCKMNLMQSYPASSEGYGRGFNWGALHYIPDT